MLLSVLRVRDLVLNEVRLTLDMKLMHTCTKGHFSLLLSASMEHSLELYKTIFSQKYRARMLQTSTTVDPFSKRGSMMAIIA